MKQYIELTKRILEEGNVSSDRTGTGTKKIFGHQSTYNMKDGFPLLGLKRTWMPGVTHELLWLLGNHTKLDAYKDVPMTNIKYLTDNKVNIWNEWADENGNLGPVYGQQWTEWKTIVPYDVKGDSCKVAVKVTNQIQIVIDKLTEGHKNFNPMDRGLLVSAWNVSELDEMALRPCHTFFQFQARELNSDEITHTDNSEVSNPKYELSLQLYQRSADVFLGVPFNVASYALLLNMICHVTGMVPGKFVHTLGDAHLYLNHKEQVNKMLSRTVNINNRIIDKNGKTETDDSDIHDYWGNTGASWFQVNTGCYEGPKLPTLWLNPDIKDIFDFQFNDIKIEGYNPNTSISAKVSI